MTFSLRSFLLNIFDNQKKVGHPQTIIPKTFRNDSGKRPEKHWKQTRKRTKSFKFWCPFPAFFWKKAGKHQKKGKLFFEKSEIF